MEKVREIREVIQGRETQDGAGVRLVRVIALRETKKFDPFLMLDAFDSSNPKDYLKGFPWHPHRGIETVTLLFEGAIAHGDSLLNQGVLRGGDCQWMKAGSGIIHQEMPLSEPRLFGLQLWINLPQKEKMSIPTYRDLSDKAMPVVQELGSTTKIISGTHQNTHGLWNGGTVEAKILDVRMKPNQSWTTESKPGHTVFLYVAEGKVTIGGLWVARQSAVLLTDGDTVTIQTEAEGARFVCFFGSPLKEPIAWGGPIVMNTEAELDLAFHELDAGTFIKTNGKAV